MSEKFSVSKQECQRLKRKLRRQQEFLNTFSLTDADIFCPRSKPPEDSFQMNGPSWRCPLFSATLSTSDGASSSTLQFRIGYRRMRSAVQNSKERFGAPFSLQNRNDHLKFLKEPSVVEPMLIDLTELPDEDGCQVLDISSSLSDDEEVPIEPIPLEERIWDDEEVPIEPIPLEERIWDPDTPEVFIGDTSELKLSRTENHAADVTDMAHVSSCSSVNGPSSNYFTTTNIEYFSSLPAFQPKVVLKRLLIGGSKNAKGPVSYIVRNIPASRNPLVLKTSPTLWEKIRILRCSPLKKTPALKASCMSPIAAPTLEEPPIFNELSVLKEPPISEVSITSIEENENISVEKFTTKGKFNESAFISEELDAFLKHDSQLQNTELQKLNTNLIPIPANDPIFSLGKLEAME